MDFDGIQEGKIINQIKTSLFKNLYYRYKIYFIKPVLLPENLRAHLQLSV